MSNLTAELRSALAHLVKARDYARDVECDPWEFAVEIDRLASLGLTSSDLRWLVKKGYVEHGREVTRPGDTARKFERCRNLAFTKRSCFFLADTAFLALESQRGCLEVSRPAAAVVAVPEPALLPHWDSEERTLHVGDQVVKEYRVRSPNQEAVLSAFQEEGWPHYIDDPLSPVADQSPKLRLRDTIKCLNANQRNHLIRFRGDGTGERVRWELINLNTPVPHGPAILFHPPGQEGVATAPNIPTTDRTSAAGSLHLLPNTHIPHIIHRASIS